MRLLTPIVPDPSAPLARANPVAKLGAALVLLVALFASLDGVTAAVVLVGLRRPAAGLRPVASARCSAARGWSASVAVSIGVFNVLFAAQQLGPTVVALGPLRIGAETLANGPGWRSGCWRSRWPASSQLPPVIRPRWPTRSSSSHACRRALPSASWPRCASCRCWRRSGRRSAWRAGRAASRRGARRSRPFACSGAAAGAAGRRDPARVAHGAGHGGPRVRRDAVSHRRAAAGGCARWTGAGSSGRWRSPRARSGSAWRSGPGGRSADADASVPSADGALRGAPLPRRRRLAGGDADAARRVGTACHGRCSSPSWLPRDRDGDWDRAGHPAWFAPRRTDRPDGLFARLADALATRGVASLRYDPRGCGESDGAWEDSRPVHPHRRRAGRDRRHALAARARPATDGDRRARRGRRHRHERRHRRPGHRRRRPDRRRRPLAARRPAARRRGARPARVPTASTRSSRPSTQRPRSSSSAPSAASRP